MWRRLHAASWWVQAVVVGLPVGVLAGVIVDFGLVEDLIAGAFSGVGMGAAVAVLLQQEWGTRRRILTAFPVEDRPTVRAAAHAGAPIPGDPALREGAARLTEVRHRQWQRRKVPLLIVVALIVGSQLYAAISEPGWWNAVTALTFVLLTASYHHQHRRLLEQAALLRAG